jgi:hypothetical protein
MKLVGCNEKFYLLDGEEVICGKEYSFGRFFCKRCHMLHSFERTQNQIKKESKNMENARPQMEIIPPNYKELTELILAFTELYKHAENKKIVDLIIITQLKPLGVVINDNDLQIKREDA